MFSSPLSALLGDSQGPRSPHDVDGDEPDTPELGRRELALTAGWSEPVLQVRDATLAWTWTGQQSTWELRSQGPPSFSEDDTALTFIGEHEAFALLISDEGGETSITAQCMSDGPPELFGTLHGRPAGSATLAVELAGVLPAVIAHTGLLADHRIETVVMRDGVRGGLREIARLTSSAARLGGYRTLLRETDDLSHRDLAALLRQAAVDLPGDGDMRELLVNLADLSFDDRALVGPLLAAAATIEDDDLLSQVLRDLLTHSDDVASATVAQLLRTATAGIRRDEPMSALLVATAWTSLSSSAARDAWRAALATVEADAPHAAAVEELLSLGDTPPDECVLALRSAMQHIETESLRAQALDALNPLELADGRVADVYVEALASLKDADVLTGELARLVARGDGMPDLTARCLGVGAVLPPDDRLASLLRAVPARQLRDAAVRAAYLQRAASLASEDDRTELLRRLPPDAAATPR